MISLYQPTVAEAAMLASLSRRTFEPAFAAQNTPEDMEAYMSEAFTEQRLTEELQDKNSIFYVATLDGIPVGYSKLRRNSLPDNQEESTPMASSAQIPEMYMELQRIYVLPDTKGSGIGKRLMEQCLQTARREGMKILWLGVWEHNTAAIAFYEKWGFERFGSHVFLLGSDAQTDLLMKREV
jgi:ribosomal protein S18 acetylase RimI-like enzyme